MLTVLALSLSIGVVTAGKPPNRKTERALFEVSMTGDLLTSEPLKKEWFVVGYAEDELYRGRWQLPDIEPSNFIINYDGDSYEGEVEHISLDHYRSDTEDSWTVYLGWYENVLDNSYTLVSLTAKTTEVGSYVDGTWTIIDEEWTTSILVFDCVKEGHGKGKKSWTSELVGEYTPEIGFVLTIDKEPL